MSVRIIIGDALAELRNLPADSVHCCVTSPPYWGLRDYNIPPQVWGGAPGCAHEFDRETVATEIGGGNWTQACNGRGEVQGVIGEFREPTRGQAERGFCCRCSAWLGCLGLEPDYRLYVEHLVDVFRAVRRALRPDGTLWLNLGDCYATGGGAVGTRPGKQGDRWPGYRVAAMGPMTQPNRLPQPGLKPKDLVGIPWRVALALQEDGWWLRRDVVWHKPNPMPESVSDRPTSAHEYLFLFARSERYFYDAAAIAEPSSPDSHARAKRGRSDHHKWADGGPGDQTIAKGAPSPGRLIPAHGNTTEDYDRLHRRQDALHGRIGRDGDKQAASAECMDPARAHRVAGFNARWDAAEETRAGRLQDSLVPAQLAPGVNPKAAQAGRGTKQNASFSAAVTEPVPMRNKRSVWTVPSEPFPEAHFATFPPGLIVPCILAGCPVGGTVLDPFGGAGTTGLVADRLGRDAILIELNPAYAAMARRRIERDAGMFVDVAVDQAGEPVPDFFLPREGRE